LLKYIEQIHAESRGTYGWPRVHAELTLGLGWAVNHKRAARLMREAGIQGLYRRRRRGCTVRDLRAEPYLDLVDRAMPSAYFLGVGPEVVRVLASDETQVSQGVRTRGVARWHLSTASSWLANDKIGSSGLISGDRRDSIDRVLRRECTIKGRSGRERETAMSEVFADQSVFTVPRLGVGDPNQAFDVAVIQFEDDGTSPTRNSCLGRLELSGWPPRRSMRLSALSIAESLGYYSLEGSKCEHYDMQIRR
jgi:hypothetical protein